MLVHELGVFCYVVFYPLTVHGVLCNGWKECYCHKYMLYLSTFNFIGVGMEGEGIGELAGIHLTDMDVLSDGEMSKGEVRVVEFEEKVKTVVRNKDHIAVHVQLPICIHPPSAVVTGFSMLPVINVIGLKANAVDLAAVLMCVCMYVYTYMQTFSVIHTNTHACTHASTFVLTHTHSYIHTFINGVKTLLMLLDPTWEGKKDGCPANSP